MNWDTASLGLFIPVGVTYVITVRRHPSKNAFDQWPFLTAFACTLAFSAVQDSIVMGRWVSAGLQISIALVFLFFAEKEYKKDDGAIRLKKRKRFWEGDE